MEIATKNEWFVLSVLQEHCPEPHTVSLTLQLAQFSFTMLCAQALSTDYLIAQIQAWSVAPAAIITMLE